MNKIIPYILIAVVLIGIGGFVYFRLTGSKEESARELLREARENEKALNEESVLPGSLSDDPVEPNPGEELTPPEKESAITPPPPSSSPSPQEVQEFEIVETIYPGKFEPSQITVKKGVPVKIYLTTTQREHINRVSILPYIASSDIILPGQVTILEFTPLETGNLEIKNIGHGFTGTIKVIN